MLYFAVIVIAQHIEANAVVRFIHFGADQMLELDELGGIHLAFEHGILYANAVVKALLGNTPQPPLSLRIFYLYIIRDQNKHVNLLLFIST